MPDRTTDRTGLIWNWLISLLLYGVSQYALIGYAADGSGFVCLRNFMFADIATEAGEIAQ